jgi:hypothetical protein
MVRLRWIKAGDEYVAGPIIAGRNKYLVFITLPKFKISICGNENYDLEVKPKSLRAAKIQAKKELIRLGARFYDEVRF